MSISERQIEIVQTTFGQIANRADEVAILFYDNVFDIAPQVRPLFKDDMTEQRTKLMQMLSVAVNGLNKLDEIVPAVRAMGARHNQYGVTNDMYAVVGQALLKTLKEGLGDVFTEEAETAWTTVYQILADTAIAGADEAMAQPN